MAIYGLHQKPDTRTLRDRINGYTGVKDSNGKKIYAGDTVVQCSGGEPYGNPSKVFFKDGSYMVYIDEGMYLEMSQNGFGFKKYGR